MFGSMVRFSRTADRMALFPVSPNPRWRKISNGHISETGRPIDFMFDPRVGFSGTANDHISAVGMSYPIHFHQLRSNFGGIQEKIN